MSLMMVYLVRHLSRKASLDSHATPAKEIIGKWITQKVGRQAGLFLATSFGSSDPDKPDLGPDPAHALLEDSHCRVNIMPKRKNNACPAV